MATDISTPPPATEAAWRFVEFFSVAIRNPKTRGAYARIIVHFLSWFTLGKPDYPG